MTGLKYVRKLYNLSLQELGKELDISYQTISKWETGKIPISHERAELLAKHFAQESKYFIKEITDYDMYEILRKKIANDFEKGNIYSSYIDKITGNSYKVLYIPYDDYSPENAEKKQQEINVPIKSLSKYDAEEMLNDIKLVSTDNEYERILREDNSTHELLSKFYEIHDNLSEQGEKMLLSCLIGIEVLLLERKVPNDKFIADFVKLLKKYEKLDYF